jgi:hypothetical protein
MSRSHYYQDHANRCTHLANSAVDEVTRQRLVKLAGEHAAMAEGLAKDDGQAASEGNAV